MISYENTKTVQDLVWNTGREYAGRVFLRYEENDVVYEVTYGEFADQCHAVAAWLREQDAAAGHKVRAVSYTHLGLSSFRQWCEAGH